MVKRWLVCGIILLSLIGCSWKQYTKAEKGLAICSAVNGAFDIYSTNEILANGGYEMNPLLGRHPNPESVAMFIFTEKLIEVGLSELFPKLRPWVYGGGCAIGTVNSIHQYRVLKGQ